MSEATSFDVLTVKIGAYVLAVGRRKNSPPQKKTSHVMRIFVYLGGQRGYSIVINFCTWVEIPAQILVTISVQRFQDGPNSPLTCVVVWHYRACQCVISRWNLSCHFLDQNFHRNAIKLLLTHHSWLCIFVMTRLPVPSTL